MPLKWTVEQRTFLHLLREDGSYILQEVADIFNFKFEKDLKAAGYPRGVTSDFLRDEYNGKLKAGRSKMWRSILAARQNAEETAKRRWLEDEIEAIAATLNIREGSRTPAPTTLGKGDPHRSLAVLVFSPMKKLSESAEEKSEDEDVYISKVVRAERGTKRGVRSGPSPLDDIDEEMEEDPASNSGNQQGHITSYEKLTGTSSGKEKILKGINGRAKDGATLYETKTADEYPDRIWCHVGGGRWREDFPKDIDLSVKTQIRVPKNAVIKPGSGHHLNTGKSGAYNVVTGNRLHDVFNDPFNIVLGNTISGGKVSKSTSKLKPAPPAKATANTLAGGRSKTSRQNPYESGAAGNTSISAMQPPLPGMSDRADTDEPDTKLKRESKTTHAIHSVGTAAQLRATNVQHSVEPIPNEPRISQETRDGDGMSSTPGAQVPLMPTGPPLEMIHCLTDSTLWFADAPYASSLTFINHESEIYRLGGKVVRAVIDARDQDVMLCRVTKCTECSGPDTTFTSNNVSETNNMAFVHMRDIEDAESCGYVYVARTQTQMHDVVPEVMVKAKVMFWDGLAREAMVCDIKDCETCKPVDAMDTDS